MNGNQIQALIGMLATFALLAFIALPSFLGLLHEKRIDRELREAQERHGGEPRQRQTQKSSSRSTVPSTATWYAEGRRSKKLVSS